MAKKRRKTVKIKESRQTRVSIDYIRLKSGTMRSGPTAGLAGYTFDLVSERACFWPQTDQVHLFFAVDQKMTTEM